MPGSATYTPSPSPLSRKSVPVYVARYTGYGFSQGSPADPDKAADPAAAAADPRLILLPNIRPVKSRHREGADPGSAAFRYILGERYVLTDPDWPSRPEQVLGFDRVGPYNVRVDDRVCLYALTSAGEPRILFDGFVQLPSSTIEVDRQEVAFQALGTPIRCWDYPLWGAVYRSAATPEDRKLDRKAYGPIRFNPDGLANATDADFDGKTGDFDHPCFLDPEVCADRKVGRRWTVSMAARYILARGNRHEAWVKMPRLSDLDSLLDSRTPKEGTDKFDPADPDTFDARPIVLEDLDVAGLPWPEALAKVVEPHGFAFRFRLGVDPAGTRPAWDMEFYRTDFPAPGSVVAFTLQPAGEALDPAGTQVGSMRLTRDAVDTANEYQVECRRTRREASFVLEAGYLPDPADVATAAAMEKFKLSHPDHLTVVDKYRTYVFDEAGDGHWDRASNEFATGEPTSLAKTLGGPDRDESRYAIRRRPFLPHLLTRDGIDPGGGAGGEPGEEDDPLDDGGEADGKKGRPLRPQLHVSTDYKGPIPGEWDGTGTWLRITSGWRLLSDRMGFYVTAENPEAWSIGNAKVGFGVKLVSSGGSIKGISCFAKAGEPRPIFRLTGVIEGDDMVQAIARRRPTSPTRFPVRRYVQGREKYRLERIEAHSALNDTGGFIFANWDQGAAVGDAASMRAKNEMPDLAGPVVIPRINNVFGVGRFASGILGRGISFRLNAAAEGEAARYPRIVEVTHQFEPEQSTTLQLGDSRGAPDGG